MKQPTKWYEILAAAHPEEEVEILIYSEIGRDFFGDGIAAEDFVKELQAIKAKTLNVRINSVGGQVFDGLAIYNALQRHSARVVTHVDGIAASIASIVALAGEEINIASNAFLMVHDPHGFAMGNASDMREMAEILDKVGGSLVSIYAERSGKSEEEVAAWMDAETWFTATEAEKAGLVDKVTEPLDVKASGDMSKFTNVPTAVAARVVDEPEEVEVEEVVEDGPSPELLQVAAESQRVLAGSLL